MTEETLAQSLQSLGFRLEPSEVAFLAQRMGQGDGVRRSTLAAALGDWPTLLQDHRCAFICLAGHAAACWQIACAADSSCCFECLLSLLQDPNLLRPAAALL